MLAGVITFGFASCSDDDDPTPTNPGGDDHVLTGNITSNKTLTNDKAWTLKGYVYVQNGATLTIPEGTLIKSDIVEKGALIIEQGGKLIANGTASKPIVFTSGQPKGQRRAGDWGGIILLGKAPTNRGTSSLPTIEGGVGRVYGGTDANDNSGSMKYVRIEFAGIAAAPGSEINGLTFGGVGSGTTIENIMVSYGNDDAYEFFGGTVNCKNMIAWACSDDDFDFDFGYTGKIQFGISAKHPQYADIGDASNGIECDNDGTGTTADPRTRPVLSNFTFIGPNNRPNTQSNHNFANRFRRASRFVLGNSALAGWQKGGLSLESAETSTDFQNGTSVFSNNYIHALVDTFKAGSGSTLTAAQIRDLAYAAGTQRVDSVGALKLNNWSSLTAPSFAPQAASMLLSGGITPSYTGALADAFFQQVTFIGAIGTTDWTADWTNWDPNNATY